MMKTQSSQVVGNMGLYYACYRLSLLGWNVMPTARNARGVDILAYNHDATRTIAVQVKTLSRKSPVPIGGHMNNLFGDWVVVCRFADPARPEAFILTPAEVKANIHRGEKDGKVSYWLQPKGYERPEYREQWDRIGRGD